MAAMTNYLENKLLDWLFRAQTFTAPTTLYFACFTASPSDAGGGTEVSGGGYARKGIAASMANFAGTQGAGTTTASSGTGGTTSNNVDIEFNAPTGNWGTVVAMAVFDAATGGNMLLYGAISPSKTINSGDLAPKFAIGQWTFQIDTDTD